MSKEELFEQLSNIQKAKKYPPKLFFFFFTLATGP